MFGALGSTSGNNVYMWPYLGKPGIWDLHAYGAMYVFSTLGQKSTFCDIHVKEPFY